jgi:hypothetical protein
MRRALLLFLLVLLLLLLLLLLPWHRRLLHRGLAPCFDAIADVNSRPDEFPLILSIRLCAVHAMTATTHSGGRTFNRCLHAGKFLFIERCYSRPLDE